MPTTTPSVFLILGTQTESQQALLQQLQETLPAAQSASLSQTPALAQGWCLCCQMHNETSEVLRQLFMLALQKKISPFSQVLLKCHPSINPASIAYTISQDFFIKERFRWIANLLVIDLPLIQEITRQETLDITTIHHLIPLFTNADLMVCLEDTWSDKQLQQSFDSALLQIYTHIQCFQPEVKIPSKLSIQQLDKTTLEYYIALWQKRSPILKRHSLFG